MVRRWIECLHLIRLRANEIQDLRRGGPIMRLIADVVQPYDAFWVDQNVPTHLKNIFSGLTAVPGQNLRDVF